jgi:hypothetical protein
MIEFNLKGVSYHFLRGFPFLKLNLLRFFLLSSLYFDIHLKKVGFLEMIEFNLKKKSLS